MTCTSFIRFIPIYLIFLWYYKYIHYFPVFITSMYIWIYLFKYSWFLYIYLISSDFSKCSLSSNFCRFHMVFNLNNHCLILTVCTTSFLMPLSYYRCLWSDFGIKVLQVSYNELGNVFSSILWKNLYKLVLFLPKAFYGICWWSHLGLEFFFVGKVLIKNSIYLEDMGPFIFFISPVPLARFFKESFISFKLLYILILKRRSGDKERSPWERMIWEKTWEWDLKWCPFLDVVYASLVEGETLGEGEVENNVFFFFLENNVWKIAYNWINAKLRSFNLL